METIYYIVYWGGSAASSNYSGVPHMGGSQN